MTGSEGKMDTTVWRWFPAGLIATMGLVVAVNGYMIYDAYHTFPGAAGQDGFDLSNAYKRVLATAQQQAALGWQIEADATAAHYPVLRLADRNGAPLGAATIEASAERPVGPATTTALTFRPVGAGQYQADTALFSGQWDIMLTVRAADRSYSATRRVVVK
jgi:nitrogen fixation protein FixH